MIIKAPAKINWSIDILGKRKDEYHLVDMVMQQIELFDVITVLEDEKITITCDNKNVPTDETNLCYKAAVLYFKKAGMNKGVRINIEKHIPVEAGLAGGSTDGAAVLKALNEMYAAFNEDELLSLAANIGADVPFCLKGGAARATNIGDELKGLDIDTKFNIVLIKPPLGVCTKQIYSMYDSIDKENEKKFTQATLDALKEKDVNKLAKSIGNALEPVTFSLLPDLNNAKDAVIKTGALKAIMSGSGPTIIGLYRNKEDAVNAEKQLKNKFKDYFVYETKTL